jgi:hypothetical protein
MYKHQHVYPVTEESVYLHPLYMKSSTSFDFKYFGISDTRGAYVPDITEGLPFVN